MAVAECAGRRCVDHYFMEMEIKMKIEITEAYSKIAEIETLFAEYTAALGIDLGYQNYAGEIASLPGCYARPGGRLYLAYCGGLAAGCIGLRKFDDERCELKRLYVRDPFRGHGIGKRLAQRVIEEAKAIGYKAVLLDTLATMERARALYKKLGFIETSPYYESPVEDTKFLCLTL